MIRFFSTAAGNKVKQLVQNSSKSNNHNTYQQNLDWMQQQMKNIKPNPGYKRCDASGLGIAMEEALPKEVGATYNR